MLAVTWRRRRHTTRLPCCSLADCLEREGEVAPRLLQTAADTMAEGFIRSR